MKPVYSITDLRTPEGIERVLRQFSSAIGQAALSPAKLPDLAALALKLAPMLRDQLQVGGAFPLNIQSLLPGDISQFVIEGTHAQRLTLYPAGNYLKGTLYYETDRTVFYIVEPNTTTGNLQWFYVIGSWRSTHALRPGGQVTGATNATPIVITTSAAHNLSNGDTATVSAVLGNTAANGEWLVTVASPTTFALNGSTGNGAYAGAGRVVGFGVNDTNLLYFETDRNATYRVTTISAALRYLYAPELSSPDQELQANLPVDLNLKGDASGFFRVDVTDYQHTLQWTGSAWQFVPEDSGSNFFIDAPGQPEGGVWTELDGSTVSYLKADGTLGSITLPDEKSGASGVYHKSIAAYTGTINAAVAPTLSGSTAAASTGVTVNSNTTGASLTVGTVAVQSGSGTTVVNSVVLNDPGHSHGVTDPTHTHGVGTLTVTTTAQPRNLGVRRWFRQ